jgi:hypothetical protein
MQMHVAEFTHLTRVDLHLMGNDYAKISENLELPTCASIFMHMELDLEILRIEFCIEYGKLSQTWGGFQNYNWFGRYGWVPSLNLPKLQ